MYAPWRQYKNPGDDADGELPEGVPVEEAKKEEENGYRIVVPTRGKGAKRVLHH